METKTKISLDNATTSPHSSDNGKLTSTKSTKRDCNDQTKPNSTTLNLPKFLVVTSPNHTLGTMSPFLIQKGFIGIGGNPKSVKKLKSGDFLIETTSDIQTNCFLAAKSISSIPISVSPHNSLNSSRGVISEPDLQNCTEEEIVHELSSSGVTHVKRITIKRANEFIKTKHLILTFNTPNIPSYINAGYLRCSVRPYVPNPLRCFKCQRFGHSKIACRGKETCPKCGNNSPDHNSEDCTAEFKCVNCSGPHPSYSRVCPQWQLEKKIQETKTERNLSYPEARNIVASCYLKPNITFAAATKSKIVNSRTFGTQTETDVNLNLNETPNISHNNTQQQTKSTLLAPPKLSLPQIQIHPPKVHKDKSLATINSTNKASKLKSKNPPKKIAKISGNLQSSQNATLESHSKTNKNPNLSDPESENLDDAISIGNSSDYDLPGMDIDENLELPPNLLPKKKPSKINKENK